MTQPAGDGEASQPTATPAVGREAWLALGVTTLVFFLVVTDISAVNVAFPSIADELEVSTAELSWIISGYNVTVAALLLFAGRLADSIGRKRVFLPGVAIFLAGSLLCGAAPTIGFLIAARIIQATGGAVLAATALAVVLPDFPASRRSSVIGLAGATGGLGAVFGPVIGSIVIDLWSWRGIFWINVPICVVVLIAGRRLLRESSNPDARGRIDLVGVALGTAAIAMMMVAIVQSESWGLDGRVAGLFAGGLVLVPVLLHRSAHHPEPLVELPLFRSRSFRATNIGFALYALGFTSGHLASSLLLQDLWDQPITTTGQALVVPALIAAVTAPLSGRLADRIGHRWILCGGSALSALGYGLYYLLLGTEPHVFDVFVPIGVLTGIGTGTTIATWASAGLSDVEPAQFGTANATIRTTQQVFFALGVAVMVTLLASGGGTGELGGYQRAWLWVIGAYLSAALTIAVLFPAGSSADRLARPGDHSLEDAASGAVGDSGDGLNQPSWWRRASRAAR